MIERPGLNLLNAVLRSSCSLAGLLLIPRFGVTGAALAMCFGFAVQGVLRFAEVRHVFGWTWPWASLVRPLAAAAMPQCLRRASDAGRSLVGSCSGLCLSRASHAGVALARPDPADREIWRRLLKQPGYPVRIKPPHQAWLLSCSLSPHLTRRTLRRGIRTSMLVFLRGIPGRLFC